jgi:type VI secretion system protein ImpH
MDASKRDAAAPLMDAPVSASPAVAEGREPSAPEAGADDGPSAADQERAGRLEVARRRGFSSLLLLLDRLVPGSLEVGGEAAPDAEQVRFRHDPSLAFSSSDVVALAERRLGNDPTAVADGPRRRWEVTTSFLGITGTVSPLPPYIQEEVVQEDPGDQRSRAFLDLFHHRALSFLARGQLKYDPAAAHLSDAADPWSSRLLAWLGVDEPHAAEGRAGAAAEGAGGAEPGLSRREARFLPLRAAALLAERALTVDGLEAILNEVMRDALADGARVAVEQFVGVWLPIPEADRTRLGISASALGRSVVLGRQVFDRSSRVAVVVGPLDRRGYERFVVEASARERLRSAITSVSGGDLVYDLVLSLPPGAAPPARLGAAGSRLGVDAWLGRQGEAARLCLARGVSAAVS